MLLKGIQIIYNMWTDVQIKLYLCSIKVCKWNTVSLDCQTPKNVYQSLVADDVSKQIFSRMRGTMVLAEDYGWHFGHKYKHQHFKDIYQLTQQFHF